MKVLTVYFNNRNTGKKERMEFIEETPVFYDPEDNKIYKPGKKYPDSKEIKNLNQLISVIISGYGKIINYIIMENPWL